jgi:hypothetical protein
MGWRFQLLFSPGLPEGLLISVRNDAPRFNKCNPYRNFLDDRGTDGGIARLSKKCPWSIHAISGPLKINMLQSMENHKMIEFGVFRQPQQFHAPWEDSMKERQAIFDPASLFDPFTEEEIKKERESCPFLQSQL